MLAQELTRFEQSKCLWSEPERGYSYLALYGLGG